MRAQKAVTRCSNSVHHVLVAALKLAGLEGNELRGAAEAAELHARLEAERERHERYEADRRRAGEVDDLMDRLARGGAR